MARQPDPDAVEDPEEFVEFAKLCDRAPDHRVPDVKFYRPAAAGPG